MNEEVNVSVARQRERVTTIYPEQVQKHDLAEKRNRRRRRRLIQRLVFVLTVVLVLFGALTTYHIKQRITYAEKQVEYETLVEEMSALEREKGMLEEEINLLNDDEYILDIARTNYFLSKKGELIFQVIEEDNRQY